MCDYMAEDLLRRDISEEMKESYINYAMSVIIGRALPDVRDGLKPVHRRILWGMHQAGHSHEKGYSKSARSVGEVMGSSTLTEIRHSMTRWSGWLRNSL